MTLCINQQAGTAAVAKVLVAESGKGLDGIQAHSGHPCAAVSISAAIVLCKVGCAEQLPEECTPHRVRLIEVACEAVATAIACWVVPSSSSSPPSPSTASPPLSANDNGQVDAMATGSDDVAADVQATGLSSLTTDFSSTGNSLPSLGMLKELLVCPTRLAAVSVPAGAALADVLVAQLAMLTSGPLDVAACQCLQRILAVLPSGAAAATVSAADMKTHEHILAGLMSVVASSRHRVEARVEAAVAAMVCNTRNGTGTAAGNEIQSVDAVATDLASRGDNWAVYRLARQAAALGSHSTASNAFDAIRNFPASEHFAFWLAGLSHLCAAEESCSAGRTGSGDATNTTTSVAVAKHLTAATSTFHASRIALKAAVQPKQLFKFQLEYIEFRIEMTAVLLDAIKCIGNLSRRGNTAVTESAAPCFARLHKLVLRLVALQRGHFDLDHASMVLLDTLRDALGGLAYAFGRILVPASVGKLTPQLLPSAVSGGGNSGGGGGGGSGGNLLSKLVERLVTELDEQCPHNGSAASSTPVNTATMAQSLRWLLDVVVQLASSSQPVPRFFFWNGTPTTIQMFLTQDADAASGGVVEIPPDSDFVFVVEGVVRAGGPEWKATGSSSRDHKFREVAEVVLDVRIQPKGGAAASSAGGGASVLSSHKREVAVHKSSFRTTFLIKLPVKTPGSAGVFEAVVAASLLDASGRMWTTGATSTLSLAVQADKVRRA